MPCNSTVNSNRGELYHQPQSEVSCLYQLLSYHGLLVSEDQPGDLFAAYLQLICLRYVSRETERREKMEQSMVLSCRSDRVFHVGVQCQ